MPIYTLSLSTYDFGIADLLNNSLQLIIPIFTLSISDGIFRFSLDKGAKYDELLSNGIRILNYSYIVVALGIAIAILFRAETYWIYFGILYITESFRGVLAQFTRGLGKVKEFAINGIIAAIALFISTYFLISILNYGIDGYLLSFIIANTCAILYLLFCVGIRKYISASKYNRVLIGCLIAYCLPLVPNMLSWWITSISSRYIIAFYSGLTLSGLFAAASKIPALINIISSIFQMSWQFASVKEYNESNKSVFYSIVFKYYTTGIILIGAILIALMPQISRLVLKGDFYEAWTFTPLLLLSSMIGCFSVFFGTFYAVVKENKKAMTTTVVGSIVNIVVCLTLIPFYDAFGALIANLLSYIIIVYLRVQHCKNYIALTVNWPKIIISLSLILTECILMMINTTISLISAYLIPIILIIIYFNDIITIMFKVRIYLTSRF